MLATSGTEAGLDRDAEQTGTPDTMVAHPTSSVYGAGATGPALAQARETTKQDYIDPSLVTLPTAREILTAVFASLDYLYIVVQCTPPIRIRFTHRHSHY